MTKPLERIKKKKEDDEVIPECKWHLVNLILLIVKIVTSFTDTGKKEKYIL